MKGKKIKNFSIDNNRSIEDDFKALLWIRTELKRANAKPNFCLTPYGVNAEICSKSNKDIILKKTYSQLFVEDIQHLLLKCLFGRSSPIKARWCDVSDKLCFNHVVLFAIDGLSKNSVVNSISSFSKAVNIFSNILEMFSPDIYSLNFATEICAVHLIHGHQSTIIENNSDMGYYSTLKSLSTIFPIQDLHTDSADASYSKLHLLLTPAQLIMEKYPMPQNVYASINSDGYCLTKDKYKPVSAQSPLYSLDCEMCIMCSGEREVVNITICDEELNILYSTLVKPKNRVANYMTKYSGVTEEMLSNVKVTIDDVREKLKSLLPADSILCGQSLNCDLEALKMIHPYVIDTSVIYNQTGIRRWKSKLKVLSEIFLNEIIQESNSGHNPNEDCTAVMKLVKLKLQNGPQFGDVILSSSGKCTSNTEESTNTGEHSKIEKMEESTITGVLTSSENTCSISFFSKVLCHNKTACIIANENTHVHYPKEMVSNAIKRVIEPNPAQIIEQAVQNISSHDFTVCHLDISSHAQTLDLFSNIDGCIAQIYSACPPKTLFMTVATGLNRRNNNNIYENGLCMIKNIPDKNESTV